MAIHGQTAVQGYDESVARSNGRQAACTNCAKAKQACDGQQPCSRCQKKQATCVYGMRNKRNQQARQVPSPSTASSTSQSVTILPSMDDVSALPSTHQNFFRPAPSMDDDNNTSYSVTETQQTFKETRALPVSLELADYASSVSENQNLLWDQAGVDNLNAPGTSDPLPGMDLDSLAFGSLPGLSFYAFDFGSLLPSPSTSIPRTRQGPTINFHQQYGSEVPQLEEGCQIEAMAELRSTTVVVQRDLLPHPSDAVTAACSSGGIRLFSLHSQKSRIGWGVDAGIFALFYIQCFHTIVL
ncbi:hypothetical protein FOMA001_g13882 [Fusarium oxysporum f. sp. matthiolae]|nr:hypothetical protein FOMA001_g13882 [Fusarium oxysporum f. sp. matthiolae]